MKAIIGIALAAMLVTSASAQDSPFRKELKRGDLTGTNMEVVTSISEFKPGDTPTLHIHHGEESYYFLEGGTIELPDGKQVPLPTGAVGLNVRDTPHGAFKVVGDKTIKLLTVHIVDKGKPLYDTRNSIVQRPSGEQQA
ncbi:cupin domain-containing protein [Bradyrhizobium sp. 26S5]|uniref:cupin domain-containing protein n=1 Tax=Bradyrhizobium sp. 26S5 TaxID=3139729 RepID=UPI0030CD9AD4